MRLQAQLSNGDFRHKHTDLPNSDGVYRISAWSFTPLSRGATDYYVEKW